MTLAARRVWRDLQEHALKASLGAPVGIAYRAAVKAAKRVAFPIESDGAQRAAKALREAAETWAVLGADRRGLFEPLLRGAAETIDRLLDEQARAAHGATHYGRQQAAEDER